MNFPLLFLAFAALSGLITILFIVACALDARLAATDRKAQELFFHNPFRTTLSFRTFPRLILNAARPQADLTILHNPLCSLSSFAATTQNNPTIIL